VNRLKQNPDKSDHDDAEILADLLRVDYLPDVWLAPLEILQLRRLVRYRQGLAADRKNIKQRIRALLREERMPKPGANPWTKAWFLWLRGEAPLPEQARWVMDQLLQRLTVIEEHVANAEERLRTVTEHDAIVQALLQQKGVGLVTAVTLRAEIGEFHRFRSGKQLARFCTVTPLNASTGKHRVEGGLVRQGNPELRRIVLETAQRLARYEPKWHELKQRLKRQGKPGAVAVAAVANRWVRWLYHRMTEVPALAA
jgi:transposase